MEKGIRVLVIDDHQVVREGLWHLLGREEDIEIIGQGTTAQGVLSQVEILSPDIVLMDVKMPGLDGIELTRQITQKSLPCKVIMLTMYDQYLSQAMEVGARGYLLKDFRRGQLAQAIRTVHSGEIVIDESVASQLRPGYEERQARKTKELYCPMVEEIELVIPPPVDIKQATRFTGRTEEILQSRAAQLSGSRQAGIIITVILNEAVAPQDIMNKLKHMPEVEAITEESWPFLQKKALSVPKTIDRSSTTLLVRLEKANTGTLSQKH